jgi:purine-nucleoside phosphorylase
MEIAVPAVLASFEGFPRIALVLGSGFGGVASAIEIRREVPYAQIEGYPQAKGAIPGHAGRLVLGMAGEVPVVVFSGRVHRYQGVSALDAAYPARLAAALGADTLIVTNAAGGVNPDLEPGDALLITDHINLTGDNPLVGWPGPAGGTPFVPMNDAYDPALCDIARGVARENELRLREGVYAGLLGPTFETPAEVRYLRTVGADVVGMSTVPEVIAARALGLRVLGLSLVTNVAAGHGLGHDEVLERAARAEADLTRLLLGILSRLS